MWPTTRFSPHAKKQIVELAKKEQMLTLPQMDTIVRLSCNTAPLSRFSMLPTARGLRLFSPVDDSWTGQPQESVVPSALWAPVVRREEDLLFEQCVFRPHMSEVRAQRIDWEKSQERRVLQREEEQEREEKEREELREAERQKKRELDTATTTTKTTITPPGLAVQAQQQQQQQHQKEEDDYEFKPTSTKQTTQRSASERMKQRLTLYGLKEIEVEGNGNCQFAAASQGIYGNQKQHKQVREKAVTWLRENPDFCLDTEGKIRLRDFLNKDEFSSWEAYSSMMNRNGVWGDHLTLIAVANAFDRHIFIVTSLDTGEGSSGVTCIESKASNSQASDKPAILLSHWHELHYNALVRDEALF